MLSDVLGASAAEVDPSVGEVGAARRAPVGHYPASGRAFRFWARFSLPGAIGGENRRKSRQDDRSAPEKASQSVGLEYFCYGAWGEDASGPTIAFRQSTSGRFRQ